MTQVKERLFDFCSEHLSAVKAQAAEARAGQGLEGCNNCMGHGGWAV